MKKCEFKKCSLLIGLLFTVQNLVCGQTRTFYEHGHRIEHFTEKDGLPSWQVTGLIQDKNGYLWISTPDGILKYNGYTFTRYNIDEKIITYTLQDYLGSILSSKTGDLIIGTWSGGIIRFNPNKEAFKRFRKNEIEQDYTTNLIEDKAGDIWSGALSGINRLTIADSLINYGLKSIEKPLNSFLLTLKSKQIYAEIKNPRKGEIKKVNFELKEQKKVSVACISRLGQDNQLVDFGWIENENGERIWEINLANTLNAGGHFFFNRASLETTMLPKGNYSLHFQKKDEDLPDPFSEYTEGHARKVQPIKWQGIQLFEAGGVEENAIMSIKESYSQQQGLSDALNLGVYLDEEDDLWAHNTHLTKITKKKDKLSFEDYCTSLDSIHPCPCHIMDLLEKDAANFWVSGRRWNEQNGHSGYLGVFNKKNRTFTEIKTGMPKSGIFTNHPLTLNPDNKGNLWIGTGNSVLYKLSPPFVPVHEAEEPNVLHFQLGIQFGDAIYSSQIDKNDNLWIGTRSSGLYKIDLKHTGLQFLPLKDSLDVKDVMKMEEDAKGNIWIGTYKKGLFHINANNDSISIYKDEFKDIPVQPFLTPLLSLPNGNMLFRNRERFIEYDPISKSVVNNISLSLRGGYGYGFAINDSLIYLPSKFIININKWTVFKEFSDFLGGRGFTRGVKSKTEGFWLGAFHGNIGKFKINGNSLDTLQVSNNQAYLGGLTEAEDGNCWISTGYGFQCFLDGNFMPTTFSKEGKEHKNLYGRIFSDNNNQIWGFLPDGPKKLDIKNKRISTVHSLKEIDSPKHVIQNKNGVFNILNERGLYTFHPDSILIDSVAPQIIIKSVITDGATDEQEIREIVLTNALSFDYTKNDLTIEYVGINFNNSEQINYAYLLENHQKDWQNVDKERTARFSNLPPGDYTFKVKAANADGIWSESKSQKITILPPWWQTWWAYSIYILSIIGLLAYWYHSLQQKIKNKESQLVKEKAHSQELQTLNFELEDLNIANQRFVPNDFLQILGKKSIKDLKLGDQIATKMTVLFSDIRDYTPLSESMTPEENFKFINAYLGRVGPIIKAHGGFISTYLGDGFMALFVNESENALKASIAAQKELEDYNRERKITGKKWLKTGMGLNTGELMLGVIGDEHRYESTVISDAVNTASRMEGLTKVFGAAIILSEKTLIGLKHGDFEKSPCFAYRYLGKVKVKGKDKALKIYDLYEGETVAIRELKAQTKLIFEEGITHYFNREFGKAAECFKQVLVINETDKAAQYYLDKSVGYIVNGVTEDWSGVEEMVMK